MSFIRHRQRSITAVSPHQANRRYIVPKRASTWLLPPITDAVTWGGVTLTLTLIPGNAGRITVTGLATAAGQGTVELIAPPPAGQRGIAVAQWADAADVTAIALAISNAIDALDGFLSISALGVVDFNLQAAGVIESVTMHIGGQAA